MAEKKYDLNWRGKETVLLLKNFYFSRFLVPFHMLLTLCGRYPEIVFLHFFEWSGIFPICVADSIIALWTRSLSAAKIVSEPLVSATCWSLVLINFFMN